MNEQGCLASNPSYLSICFYLQAFKGNKATPLFQSHGEADKLVPISFGLNSSRAISTYNSNAKMTTYPGMGHTSSSQVNYTSSHSCNVPRVKILPKV